MGLVLSSSARVSQVTYQIVVGARYPEPVEQTPTGWRFGRFVTEKRIPAWWIFTKCFGMFPGRICMLSGTWAVSHQQLSTRCQVQFSNTAQPEWYGQLVQSKQLGDELYGFGCLPRSHYVCRHDSSHSHSGANASRLLERQTQTELSWSPTRKTVGATRGGLCQSHCSHHACQITVSHHGAPRYERTSWSRYSRSTSYVWSRTGVGGPCSLPFAWPLRSRFTDGCPQRTVAWMGPTFRRLVAWRSSRIMFNIFIKCVISTSLWWTGRRYSAKSVKLITDQLWCVRSGKSHQEDGATNAVGWWCAPSVPSICVWLRPWQLRISMLLGLAGARPRPWLSCSWYLDWGRPCFGRGLIFQATAMAIQHFYDAFAFESHLSIRKDALALFGLGEGELLDDLSITSPAVLRKGWGDHQEHPINRVPADVIQIAPNEQDNYISEGERGPSSEESDDSSTEHDALAEELLSSPLADDFEHELMREAYGKVGTEFVICNEKLDGGFNKLLPLKVAPKRWPLAKLTFPLQSIVDYLDRVVAGCCWEGIATRRAPQKSTNQIRQVTMLLAGYLAQEVASLFREILSHATLTLYDETTAHLLCSNYWLKPIYQELVHASSRFNATRIGEQKRPCSGLVRVSAHPKPSKVKKPSVSLN